MCSLQEDSNKTSRVQAEVCTQQVIILNTDTCCTSACCCFYFSYYYDYWHHHIFGRSCCYTVWSAIGSYCHLVCLSVCPSICDAVHCGAQGRCRMLKCVLYCRVPRMTLSVHFLRDLLWGASFSHSCCRMCRSTTTHSEKPNCRNFCIWNSHW